MISRHVLLTMTLLLSACASPTRLIYAPSPIPPPSPVSSRTDDIDVSLKYRITSGESRSWVRGAPWDEYIITITNRSNDPLVVEGIRLIDPRGVALSHSREPETLEKQSKELKEIYGPGGVDGFATRSTIPLMEASISAAGLGGAAALTKGFVVAGPVAGIGVAMYIQAKLTANANDQAAIKQEFRRRQLDASTIPAMTRKTGSLFFPAVPRPRALIISYRTGGATKEIELGLEQLP